MFHFGSVLVVQGCRELADNLVELLDALGYGARIVGSAAEARSELEKRRYPVVLLDAELPDGDGVELVAELRRRDPTQRIVVLASLLDTAHVERAEQAGASAVLRTLPASGSLAALGRALLTPASSSGGVRWTRSGWYAHLRAPIGLR